VLLRPGIDRTLAKQVAGCLAIALGVAACTASGHDTAATTSSTLAVPSAPASLSGPGSSPAPSPAVSSSPTAAPSSAAPPPSAPTSSPPSHTAAPSTPAPTPSALPFSSSTKAVTAADLGASWHAGCPVAPAQLRQISLSYWGFDGLPHTGSIVVNAAVVPAVIKVFATLYAEHFPIRRMEPVSNFGGSDDASMAVDNTSGFNCRNAVAPGPPQWSAHAYGKAIDVNTVENPYLEGGKVLPPQGAAFAKRTPYRAGMAVTGGQLVQAFAAVGWYWGGRWNSPDYQHFSSTGG
jgi:hypothetical protein